MTIVPLGDAVELAYGKSLPVRARRDGLIPVYGSNGVVGFHDEALVPEPTVIVGRKGSAGTVHLVSGPSFPIDTTYFVRPRPGVEIDICYASYALKHLDLSRLRTETGVPGLNREDAYREPFPLPPLDEQRRIVDILNRAGQIEALRARSAERLREFVPALFLKMFGSPSGDAVAWPLCSVEQIVKDGPGSIRTGPFGSQLKHSEFTDKGVPVLGIDNVVTNRFIWTQPRHITPEKYAEFRRYRVFPGDVIVTIMGTTGRACVAPDDLPECMSTKHLCVVTLDRTRVEPLFLWGALLFDQRVREQTRMQAQGQIMEGWNLSIVKSLQLRVPPLGVQRSFSRIVTRTLAVEASVSTLTRTASELRNSLMSTWLRDDGSRAEEET